MVNKLLLLLQRQNREFVIFRFGSFRISFFFELRREIIAVAEFGQVSLSSQSPRQLMVMSNEYHVVSIDGSEGRKAVTNQREESHQHVVNDVNEIRLSISSIYPP